MYLTEQTLRQMIDFTLLHNTDTPEDITDFAQKTIPGNYACAFVMPCHVKQMVQELKDYPTAHVGAPIAFPTGAEPTDIKVAMTKYHIATGADEIDFVINIGWLKSKKYDLFLDEIKKIVAAAEGHIVKAILEVTCLTDEEIAIASQLVYEGGADFVKTGTGCMPNPTTIHHIEIISKALNGKISIKAAGGIRDIDTIIAMLRLGVTRFGISWSSALKIIDEFNTKYPNGIEIN